MSIVSESFFFEKELQGTITSPIVEKKGKKRPRFSEPFSRFPIRTYESEQDFFNLKEMQDRIKGLEEPADLDDPSGISKSLDLIKMLIDISTELMSIRFKIEFLAEETCFTEENKSELEGFKKEISDMVDKVQDIDFGEESSMTIEDAKIMLQTFAAMLDRMQIFITNNCLGDSPFKRIRLEAGLKAGLKADLSFTIRREGIPEEVLEWFSRTNDGLTDKTVFEAVLEKGKPLRLQIGEYVHDYKVYGIVQRKEPSVSFFTSPGIFYLIAKEDEEPKTKEGWAWWILKQILRGLYKLGKFILWIAWKLLKLLVWILYEGGKVVIKYSPKALEIIRQVVSHPIVSFTVVVAGFIAIAYYLPPELFGPGALTFISEMFDLESTKTLFGFVMRQLISFARLVCNSVTWAGTAALFLLTNSISYVIALIYQTPNVPFAYFTFKWFIPALLDHVVHFLCGSGPFSGRTPYFTRKRGEIPPGPIEGKGIEEIEEMFKGDDLLRNDRYTRVLNAPEIDVKLKGKIDVGFDNVVVEDILTNEIGVTRRSNLVAPEIPDVPGSEIVTGAYAQLRNPEEFNPMVPASGNNALEVIMDGINANYNLKEIADISSKEVNASSFDMAFTDQFKKDFVLELGPTFETLLAAVSALVHSMTYKRS